MKKRFLRLLLTRACALLACAIGLARPAETIRRYPVDTMAAGVEPARPELRVAVRPETPIGKQPGLRVDSSTGQDLLRLPMAPGLGTTSWLVLDACYASDRVGRLQLKFMRNDEAASRLRVEVRLFPGLSTRIAVPLSVLDGQTVMLPPTPGRLKGTVSGRRLPMENLAGLVLALSESTGPQTLYLSEIRVLDSEPDYPVTGRAVVDALGQRAEFTWRGKTVDEGALRQGLEAACATILGSGFPPAWSRFGGFSGRQYPATGYFHLESSGERWWLVDPEGNGFFSVGLSGVNPGGPTLVFPGMESLFQSLPLDGTPASGASTLGTNGVRAVDFGRANLIRGLGPTGRSRWTQLTRDRLQAWRFNTVGMGSDPGFIRGAKLPYVYQPPSFPTTQVKLFRDFPDVYSEEYTESCREWARMLERTKSDTYMVGYFSGNEPAWAAGKHCLAEEMLEANPGTASRRALAGWLRNRYQDEVPVWAKAWNRALNSFNQVSTDNFPRLCEASQQAQEDLWTFSRDMARRFAAIPAREAKRLDPNHLNLGMQVTWGCSELMFDAAEVFDVFSLQCSEMEPPKEVIAVIGKRTAKPVLITGFQFGALDQGLPATGPRAVGSQEQRGVAYRRYVEKAAEDPFLVGVHYAELNDQPLLGNPEGENYQVGFVDVCHRAYVELADQARRGNESIYDIMTGARAAFPLKAKETPQVW